MDSQNNNNAQSESEKKKEDWMNSKWRPAMGWIYMATCTADFILFPVLWSLLQAMLKQPVTQWQPLTLQGAGLYHIAMGAVLGIAAMGRTQEKIAGANNGGAATNVSPSITATPSVSTPVATPAPVARPMPKVAAAPVVELEADDPPVRNTRND